MTAELFYVGTFGLLAALAGVGATYFLGFRRDERIRQQEQRIMHSAIVADLKAILRGFEFSESYMPRFTSRDIFVMKGCHIFSPLRISIPLEEISHLLTRIEDITREDHAFNVAVASTGQPGLNYNNSNSLDERCDLINRAKESIPDLIQELEQIT